MSAGDVALLASVQEKVRERIQATFMELLPESVFRDLVKRELDQFLATSLRTLVREEAAKRLSELLKQEFAKPEWAEQWGMNGTRCSEMVATLLHEAAPQFVEAMFGHFAQQLVNDMRNGRLRAY